MVYPHLLTHHLFNDYALFVVLLAGLVFAILAGFAFQVYKAYRRMQNLSASVFENVPYGVALFDSDFILRKCNVYYGRFIEKYTPYTCAEAIGKSLFDYVPGNLSQLKTWFQDIRASGKSDIKQNFQLNIPSLDGELVTYWDMSLVPLPVKDRSLNGFLLFIKDVTDQGKNAREYIIKAGVDPVVSHAENSPAMSKHMQELNCLYRFTKFFEVEGANLENILPDALDLLIDSMLYPEAAFGQISIHKYDAKTANYRPSHPALHKDILAFGEPVGQIMIGYPADMAGADAYLLEEDFITTMVADRLGRLTEQIQTGQILREREETFTKLIESASEGIVLTDEKGCLIEWNRAQEEISGLRRSDAIGKQLVDIQFSFMLESQKTGELYKQLGKTITSLLAAGAGPQLNTYHEHEIRQPQGKQRIVQSISFSIQTSKGYKLCTLMRDITERKQAEQKIQDNNQRNQKLAEIAQAFSSSGLNYQAAFETITRQVGDCLAAGCMITLLNKEGDHLKPAAVYHQNLRCQQLVEEVFQANSPRAYEGLNTGILQSSQPVFLKNIEKDEFEQELDQKFRPLLAEVFPHSLLAVPLQTKGKVFGILSAWRDDDPLSFNEEDSKFLQDIADRAALVISNVQLFDETQQRSQQLSLLIETVLSISSIHDLPTMLNEVLEGAVRLLNACSGILFLADPEKKILRCAVSYQTKLDCTGSVQKYGEGLAGFVSQSHQPSLMRHNPETNVCPADNLGEPYSTVLAAPMIWQDQLIGVIQLFDEEKSLRYTNNDLELLLLFANQAATAFVNSRLLEAERQHRSDLAHSNTLQSALGEVASRLQISQDPDQLMQTLGTELKKLNLTCLITQLDSPDNVFVVRYGSFDAEVIRHYENQFGVSLLEFRIDPKKLNGMSLLFEKKDSMFISDPLRLGRLLLSSFPPDQVLMGLNQVGINSKTPMILMPFIIENEITGYMSVWGAGITPDDVQVLSVFSAQVAMAMENTRLFNAILQQRKQLVHLGSQVLKAGELEKKRLSQELHDQVGQLLTALGLNINIISSMIPPGTNPKVFHLLDDSLNLLHQSVERTRDLMSDLRPTVLDDYGLDSALRWYLDRFRDRTGLRVVYHSSSQNLRLDAEVETAFFRIAQEALNNVAKYAQAKTVTVEFIHTGLEYRLSIIDDGVGFLQDNPDNPDLPHWGLITMRERAEALGGSFRIDSAPGQGTKVTVQLGVGV